MRTLLEWVRRLWGTIRKNPHDEDMEEELRLHMELSGKSRAGGLAQAMDAMRDQRGLPWLEDLVGDIHHAVRSLRRTPAFTAVAVNVPEL